MGKVGSLFEPKGSGDGARAGALAKPTGDADPVSTALEATDVWVEVTEGKTATHIVRGVSLKLRRREITALVGESGSGKTMTALSLLRLLPRQARMSRGRIVVGGVDISGRRERDMTEIRGKRIAMVFQDPLAALNPVRSVGFQMTEPLVAHLSMSKDEATVRAVQLLGECGLADPSACLKRYPHELSGGMRQRVLIAMALSCNPDALIADEPTTALDVLVQARILDLIRRLADVHGIGVLLVTHDIGTAARISDNLDVMYAGQIVERGPLNQVLRQPVHPYTRALIACMPAISRRQRPMSVLQGTTRGVWGLTSGCRFAPRCTDAISPCWTDEPTLQPPDGEHAAACHVYSPVMEH